MTMFVLHIVLNLLVVLPLTDGFITQPRLAIEQKPRHRRGCVRMVGEGYMTWLSKRIELAQRPPFVKFTRARITRDFAVLLMRTSYQVCDELDFVPMDDFQKQFFLFRQDEWLPYKENFPRIKQGDLTIAMTMRNGRDIFEEKVGAEGDRRTVQRDPDMMDNARLPEEHERRVGEKLLAYCTDTFGSTKLAPVIGQGLSIDDLQEGCNRIMNLLRLNFYLLDFSVGSQLDRRILTVKATAPVTIWGQQVLAQRKDRPTNDFEAKAVLAYLRACGLVGATYSTAFNGGLDVVHTFRV